ncbi:MAG: prephenate dehydratase [Solirubrobacteraceae bacterium]
MSAPPTMRIGYFGPEGTYTQEAMLTSAATLGLNVQEVPLPTIYDTVLAVHDGSVERALVPIENSLEGSVNATLDALAHETERVEIIGEVVMPIRHCLISRTELALGEIETVVSHPQANAQCARFIRASLPQARVIAGSSTAEAVRTVAEHDGPWAALGNRTAAARYGCVVLAAGVEDVPGNETRFVWLARAGVGEDRLDDEVGAGAGKRASAGDIAEPRVSPGGGAFKTAIVFWGAGTERPGWLVACLSAFADRGVNLTRIESRPRRQGLGSYMFFVDMEGRVDDPHVQEGLTAVRQHAEVVRVIGSFLAARS